MHFREIVYSDRHVEPFLLASSDRSHAPNLVI
jgi:hypothetical protein